MMPREPIPTVVRKLAKELAEPTPMRCGSVSERFMKCGQKECRCQHDPQARHGPYFTLTRSEEGKTRSRYLSAEQAALARQHVEAGHEFRKQVERYWQAKLTSEVVWSPLPWNTVGEAGPAQRAPALASIVQEVVARSGWTAASSLVLIVRGEGSSKRAAESFEGKRESAPLVHIEYVIIP